MAWWIMGDYLKRMSNLFLWLGPACTASLLAAIVLKVLESAAHISMNIASLKNIIHQTSYVIHYTSYIIHHTSYIIHQTSYMYCNVTVRPPLTVVSLQRLPLQNGQGFNPGFHGFHPGFHFRFSSIRSLLINPISTTTSWQQEPQPPK